MKNRLELAKRLLKSNGIIIISCDDNEVGYLRVLLDEIFERENFILNGVVNRASEIASNYIVSKHEYFLCYTKNIKKFTLGENVKYTISRGTVGNVNQTEPVITFPKGLKCINIPDGVYATTRKIEGSSENIENYDDIIVENGILKKDIRLKAKWRSSNDMRNFFNNNCQPTLAKINGIIEEIYFDGDRFMPYIKKKVIEKIPSLFLDNKRGSTDLEKLDMKGSFNFPKNVGFIQNLISLTTTKNDIILDYHAGSGTTAQAVLELNKKDGGNRKFILCEQMDYIETVTVPRIQKVIDKEQSGSFVYCELLENANDLITTIEQADENNIEDIKQRIYNDERIIPYISSLELDKTNDDFKNLTLDEQKKALCLLVDKNKLYVNFSDIDDENYQVNQIDKDFTNGFYKEDINEHI